MQINSFSFISTIVTFDFELLYRSKQRSFVKKSRDERSKSLLASSTSSIPTWKIEATEVLLMTRHQRKYVSHVH